MISLAINLKIFSSNQCLDFVFFDMEGFFFFFLIRRIDMEGEIYFPIYIYIYKDKIKVVNVRNTE